jgi:hypothetical protein
LLSSGAAALGVGALGASALGGPLAGPKVRPVAPTPWKPEPQPLSDSFARGVNLAHQHVRGRGYGSASAAQALDALVDLGIRDVALNPFAYTPSLGSTEIRHGGDPTLTDDDLARQIEQAHTRGMRVLLKPHLWSGHFWGGDVGNPDIAPPDWKAWFTAYTDYVVHHARIARRTGCEGLCVGLEYTRATRENPGAWAAVAAACRAEFPGRVGYAANWYEEYAAFTDWDAFDCVGVNAYFPLRGETLDALVASWGEHLDAIERVAKGKPVVFPEAGYRAVAGATERPWESGGGPPDLEIQARAYEALLRAAAARPWFQGVYWWKWFTADGPDTDPFVPAGPAQAVLRAWFRQAR